MAEPTNNDDLLLMGSTEYEPSFQIETPQVAPSPAPQPVQPSDDEQGFWNQFYGSIGSTVFQDNPRLSGRAIEGLGRVSGSDAMKDWGQGIVQRFDESPEDEKFVPRVSSYSQVEGFNSLMDYMGSSLGQGIGSMTMVLGGAAAGAGIAGAGGAAVGAVGGGGVGAIPAGAAAAVGGGVLGGTVASSFLLNYGDTYDYLVAQEGMNEDQAANFALVPGSIMAGLDSFAVTRIVGPARQTLSRNLIKRTMQLAGRGATTEGLTEAAQQVVQEFSGELAEAAGYAANDIEFAQRFENTINSFIVGGLTGGVVGGATAPVARPDAEPEVTEVEVEVEPEVTEVSVEEEEVQDAPQPAEEETAPAEPVEEPAEEPAEEAVEAAAEAAEAAEKPSTPMSVNWNAKRMSLVLDFLLNPPEGLGKDQPILDSEGNPFQEQEIDESGEPVFLESGKPKMGPVEMERVYNISDIYTEDELTGKAGGLLSQFPAAEIRLFRLDDFLLGLKEEGKDTVTHSEVVDYIRENKWRMDFREVRRQTAEATGQVEDPRLDAMRDRRRAAQVAFGEVLDALSEDASFASEGAAATGLRPQFVLPEPSTYEVGGHVRTYHNGDRLAGFAGDFHSSRGEPLLRHALQSGDLEAGFDWIDGRSSGASWTLKDIHQKLSSLRDPEFATPSSRNPRPRGWVTRNEGSVTEALDRIEPDLDWNWEHVRSDLGFSTADVRAELRIPELIDKIESRIAALGGRARAQQLRSEMDKWVYDNTVPEIAAENVSELSGIVSSAAYSGVHDPFAKLNAWAKTSSIFSEGMPKRQKAVFMSGFEKIKAKSNEAALINELSSLVDGENGLRDLETVLMLRQAYEGIIETDAAREHLSSRQAFEDLNAEIEASKPPEPSEEEVGYKISGSSLAHPSLSLQGSSGNKKNSRQIIMINPTQEMREFQRIMETPGDPDKAIINQLKRAIYKSGHWRDSLEVGAGIHIRVTDQTVIIDGVERKILLIEEIQYDHGQDHRKFGTKIGPLKLVRLEQRAERLRELRPDSELSVDQRSSILEDLESTIGTARRASRPEVSFPNTEDWVQVGVRRAFQIAAEEGYDGVAFIGGASAGPITMFTSKETRATSILTHLGWLSEGNGYFANVSPSTKLPAEKWMELIDGAKLRSGRGTGSPLNEAAYNEAVEKNTGLYKWLQKEDKVRRKGGPGGILLSEVKNYLSHPQIMYPGSAANVHYDKNVVKQAELITGQAPLSAIDELEFIVNGEPITATHSGVTPELKNGSHGHISFKNGVAAYKHTPPKMWLFNDELREKMAGPQPLLSTGKLLATEKKAVAVEGDWGKPLSELLGPHTKERKEGVVYFEDMKPVDRILIVNKIAKATSGLPNLEYPFTASLGKPGGAAVTVVGHLKANLLSVEMPNGKSSKMPASNLFIGNERVLETEPPMLVKPALRAKIRAEHLKSIKAALAEGLEVPEEVLQDYPELLGSGMIEEDQEIEVEPEADPIDLVDPNTKVVDESGKPLLVYHGTPKGRFDKRNTEVNAERKRILDETARLDQAIADIENSPERLQSRQASNEKIQEIKDYKEEFEKRWRARNPADKWGQPAFQPSFIEKDPKYIELVRDKDRLLEQDRVYSKKVAALSNERGKLPKPPRAAPEGEGFKTRASGWTDAGYRSIGAYFTSNREEAEGYARNRATDPIVYEVYLNLLNPYEHGVTERPEGMIEEINRRLAIEKRKAGKHWLDEQRGVRASIRRDVLEEYGFDGEIWTDRGLKEYIAFEPEQVIIKDAKPPEAVVEEEKESEGE